MHIALTNEIIKVCRQREKDGDCPTVEAPGRETLEFAVIDLADRLDKAKADHTRLLAEAMKAFAPDLMKEFVERFNYAKLSPDEKLDRLIAVLRT
jgi:hypothetical protein